MAELYFSEAVQEMLSGRNVHAALGVWFDFASGVERVWLGSGTFTAKDGTQWSGMGELAAIDGVAATAGLSTEPITLTLSGLDATIRMIDQKASFPERCAPGSPAGASPSSGSSKRSWRHRLR